jgi:hypothetical protein
MRHLGWLLGAGLLASGSSCPSGHDEHPHSGSGAPVLHGPLADGYTPIGR